MSAVFYVVIIIGAIIIALAKNKLDHMFKHRSYKKQKKEWDLLSEDLNFNYFKKKKNLKDWLLGSSFSMNGILETYPVELSWQQPQKDERGKFTCHIELRNPKEITFYLSKKIMSNLMQNMFSKTKNIIFDDPYFKKNFVLKTDNVTEVSMIFDNEIHQRVRKMFAIELRARLEVKRFKRERAGNEILDSSDQYFLVYTNDDFSIRYKRESLFVKETLQTMLEIAKRMDQA